MSDLNPPKPPTWSKMSAREKAIFKDANPYRGVAKFLIGLLVVAVVSAGGVALFGRRMFNAPEQTQGIQGDSVSGTLSNGGYRLNLSKTAEVYKSNVVLISAVWTNNTGKSDYMPTTFDVKQDSKSLDRDDNYVDPYAYYAVMPGETVHCKYAYKTDNLKSDLEVSIGSKATGLVGTTIKIRGE